MALPATHWHQPPKRHQPPHLTSQLFICFGSWLLLPPAPPRLLLVVDPQIQEKNAYSNKTRNFRGKYFKPIRKYKFFPIEVLKRRFFFQLLI